MRQAGGAVSEYTTDTGRKTPRFEDCDILNHLASRGVISTDQQSCGVRYYRDWYESGLAASGVIDPGAVVVDGGNREPAVVHRMEALHNWAAAARGIGPVLSHPLVNMVLLDMPATVYAMQFLGQQDPKNARLASQTVLKISLDALVLHYLGPRRTRTRYLRGDDAVPENRPELREAS